MSPLRQTERFPARCLFLRIEPATTRVGSVHVGTSLSVVAGSNRDGHPAIESRKSRIAEGLATGLVAASHDRVMRHRFPGLADGWARFDGPAGTQMVDAAIDAIAGYLRTGDVANGGGRFTASQATGTLAASARASVGRLLGADPGGVVFGANMTTLVFALTRAIGRTLGAGDEIVGTRLDHDANITPWRIATQEAGAAMRLAPFDPATGRLDPAAVIDCIGPRTRWVAITGASNVLGTIPDLAPVIAAAHTQDANVLVDAVHLVPHRPIDVARLDCDAIVTSAYKWYGPHAGVLWLSERLRDELSPYKVRPAPDSSPSCWETGTPAYEAIAGVGAAADFLLETGVDRIAAHEREIFAGLLEGLLGLDHVRVLGPATSEARAPTVSFTVRGRHPDEVVDALAAARVAGWSGSHYAVEAVEALGLAASGGTVRAGLSCYSDAEDVARLLAVVSDLR